MYFVYDLCFDEKAERGLLRLLRNKTACVGESMRCDLCLSVLMNRENLVK